MLSAVFAFQLVFSLLHPSAPTPVLPVVPHESGAEVAFGQGKDVFVTITLQLPNQIKQFSAILDSFPLAFFRACGV